MLVLPILLLDITWVHLLIGFTTLHITAGLILGIIFQLAHVVEETDHPLPDEENMIDEHWMIHEMVTTNNFARNNKALCWFVGGLNFQIEHHLFPKVCSIHYPAISPIVEETAVNLGSLTITTIHFLKRLLRTTEPSGSSVIRNLHTLKPGFQVRE
jgi:linoleoyl-CoA desaturase